MIHQAPVHGLGVMVNGSFVFPGGWKKFEPLWDWVIRARNVSRALPLLEAVLG